MKLKMRLAAAAASVLVLGALALGEVTQTGAATLPCGSRSAQTQEVRKVIWIWMENHSYSQIIGSSSAPFENQLANQCGLATNYRGITHPSLPNYIAATAGSTKGVTRNGPPSSWPLSGPSIFSQGSSWRGYEGSMPTACRLTRYGNYVVRHNPAAYYTSIRSICPSHEPARGGRNFRNDLQDGSLPRFSFFTPNNCSNMHACSIRTGDSWLRSMVGSVTSSPDYRAGRVALFLTFDEDNGSSGNRVAMTVVSPYTTPGQRIGTSFNHYSLLRTTERLLGYSYLRNASTANSMMGFFR